MTMSTAISEVDTAIKLLNDSGYSVVKNKGTKSAGYNPYVNNWNIYQPWLGHPLIESVVKKLIDRDARTLVNRDRLYVLHQLLQNTLLLQGEIWEAGVYQGGTAMLICEILRGAEVSDTTVRLFDTFGGMPETHAEFDNHKKGDFSDTSLNSVIKTVGSDEFIHYHQGLVPVSFAGLEYKRIKFAHVDLDIYEPIKASCEFIWPRLSVGGAIVFDDYGFVTCPGAKKAVDEFFASYPFKPLVLPTGQAVIIKVL